MAADAEPRKEEEPGRGDGDGEEERSQPMRFSFARPKVPAARGAREKRKGAEQEGVEALAAVGEGKMEGVGGVAVSEKIIPKQEDSWELKKKARLRSLLEEEVPKSTEERFVVEKVDAGPLPGVEYGLQLRSKSQKVGQEMLADGERLGLQNGGKVAKGKGARDADWQRFHADLQALGDEVDASVYESMPIEDFGKALMRGMGWEEGKAIGRNAKGPVEPVEYVPRVGRLGLGATPKTKEGDDNDKKKILKPGDSREAKRDMVAAPGADGRVRHVKPIGEKLVERVLPGVQVGKTMIVIGGPHEGLKACVLAKESGKFDQARVKLLTSDEEVMVEAKDLADIGSLEEEDAMRKLQDRERRQSDRRSHRNREVGGHGEEKPGRREEQDERRRRSESSNHRKPEARSKEVRGDDRDRGERLKGDDRRGNEHDRVSRGNHDDYADKVVDIAKRQTEKSYSQNGKAALGSSAPPPWLMRQIKVRIVSKKVGGGRLYLKKAVILDLSSPTVCNVLVDETNQVLHGLEQDMLETALPKRGGRVAVVGGEYRGLPGKLLSRDADKGEAVVQLANSFELLTLNLDYVAEFVGDEEDGEG